MIIQTQHFLFSIPNNELIDFNGERYKHFTNTENCLLLIEFNEDLEDSLLIIIDSLESMKNEESLKCAKTLLSEYYKIKETLCK